MEEYTNLLATFSDFVKRHHLIRRAAYPSESVNDDCNPRESKFGGKLPYLKSEDCPKCNFCDQEMMMIVQLFIPSLPEFVQSHIREEDREKLLVLCVCPHCLGKHGYSIRLYGSDYLDQLVYHDDIGEEWSKPQYQFARGSSMVPSSPQSFTEFDQRRRWMRFSAVGDWTECDMVPFTSVEPWDNNRPF